MTSRPARRTGRVALAAILATGLVVAGSVTASAETRSGTRTCASGQTVRASGTAHNYVYASAGSYWNESSGSGVQYTSANSRQRTASWKVISTGSLLSGGSSCA